MPVKFDDLSKVATEVINDDYQTSGYVLKAKQMTSYGGTVLSTQVDLFPSKDAKAVATPSKLTWKWPTPFGVKQAFIDKLEVDKGGKFKLEASSSEVHPGLKLECKSDLADLSKVMTGLTYTGLKNAQVKFECKALKPQDFTGEATYTKDIATFGVKLNSKVLNGGVPDFGVRVLSGPFFCSLIAKDTFKAFNASAFYKPCAAFKCAATYTHGGGDNGKFTVGVNYKGMAKVKINQDQTVSCSVKHSVSKGFTLIGGSSYNVKKGDTSCGLQLSIE
jgi:hypothetical protein